MWKTPRNESRPSVFNADSLRDAGLEMIDLEQQVVYAEVDKR